MKGYIIALDAMGGDNAPDAIVSGGIMALRKYPDISLLLAGPEARLQQLLQGADDVRDRIEILPAEDTISMDEPPMLAVRRKVESSLVKAMMAVREGRAQAFVSAGSTGAVLAGGMLRIGRIPGIERPALAPVIPGVKKPFLLIDAGANVDCQPRYLVQFGLMGSVYMHSVMGVDKPAVGLVNIGTEAEKGNKLTKETYQLMLKQTSYHDGHAQERPERLEGFPAGRSPLPPRLPQVQAQHGLQRLRRRAAAGRGRRGDQGPRRLRRDGHHERPAPGAHDALRRRGRQDPRGAQRSERQQRITHFKHRLYSTKWKRRQRRADPSDSSADWPRLLSAAVRLLFDPQTGGKTMDRNAIFDKVKEYILMQLPIDGSRVTETARMVEDLGADSANLMMLIMDLETEFNLTVEDEALGSIKTVGDIVDYIQKKG